MDCVIVKVPELEKAAAYYESIFGLKRLWHDGHSIGMWMPETGAEITLQDNPNIPKEISAHYRVEDPFGNVLCILDMAKGART